MTLSFPGIILTPDALELRQVADELYDKYEQITALMTVGDGTLTKEEGNELLNAYKKRIQMIESKIILWR